MYIENNFKYEDKNKHVLIECLDKNIESFTALPETERINDYAFENCNLLRTVILDGRNNKDFPLSVSEYAFPTYPVITNLFVGNVEFACNAPESLKSITFTKNAVEMDSSFFFSPDTNVAPNLEEIIIEQENEFLQDGINDDFSEEGVWYQTGFNDYTNEKEISLILYPSGKKDATFVIPSFVNVVDIQAFSFNPYIKEIIFPENCKTFNMGNIIYNCENLETVVIKAKDIVISPFIHDCQNVKEIYLDVKSASIPNDTRIIPIEEYNFRKTNSFKELNKLYKQER